MRVLRAIRQWWKCNVRGLHFYRFVCKAPDGSRVLRCVRCERVQITSSRWRGWYAA